MALLRRVVVSIAVARLHAAEAAHGGVRESRGQASADSKIAGKVLPIAIKNRDPIAPSSGPHRDAGRRGEGADVDLRRAA